MEKSNLPEKIENQIKRINHIVLPEIYKAPKEAEQRDKARLTYFRRDEAGESYSTLVNQYNKITPKEKETTEQNESPGLVKRIEENSPLAVTLQRDYMMEHRQRTGLDKLKEILVNAILNQASFKEGLYSLTEHIKELKNKQILHESSPEIYIEREDFYHDEKILVSRNYPDLTADETTWFSLLRKRKKQNIFDSRRRFFHPPSLMGMDIDGLIFSDGSYSERDLDRIDSLSAHKIGGITGTDFESEHHPFTHNISEAIKAIMLLSINDKDLFEKLKSEEDIMPFLQGDTMLIKSFLNKNAKLFGLKKEDTRSLEEVVRDPDNSFSKRDIPQLREEALKYLTNCEFRDTSNVAYSPAQFVKLLGMLSRIPKFISEKETFKGYMMFYGNNMEFVKEDGRIVDSVPVTDYLKHRIADQFHDRSVSIDKHDEIINQLFKQLQDKIQERNINENNLMPIDTLQEKVLSEFGIALPIQPYSNLRKIECFSDLYIRKSVEDFFMNRTLKFGFEEVEKIHSLLSSIPKTFSKNVKSLSKKLEEYFSLDVFMSGDMTAGEYHPESQRIDINIPKETPNEESILELFAKKQTAKTKRTKRKIYERLLETQKHDNYLAHVFLHEVGESVAANLNPKIWNKWLEFSPEAKSIPLKERDKHFLTNYACRNAKEDFCETLALYFLFGKEFQKKGSKFPTLKNKYEFMKNLFSSDGKVREFENQYSHSMYIISGNPASDWEKIQQEVLLKDLRDEERISLDERILFGDEALSYNEVEELIAEHESMGKSLTRERATTIISENRKRKYEEKEELLHKSRLYNMIERTSLETLFKEGVRYGDAIQIFPDFSKTIIDATEEDSVTYLTEQGIQKEAAERIVKKLFPLVTNFEETVRERINLANKETFSSPNPIEIARVLEEDLKKQKSKNHNS